MDQSMYGVFLVILISSSSILISNASRLKDVNFDVTRYGATSGDNSDDSGAFLKAWNDACASSSESTVYVPPEGIFLINPVTFQGPCKAPTINFVISGTIMAPKLPNSWEGIDSSQWLGFNNIKGLHVYGNGLINGQGQAWWDQSCRYHPQLKNCTSLAPTAWKFLKCSESSVKNIRIIDSAQTHILVGGCQNFTIEDISVNSPGNSPNTDGIHVSNSQSVTIKHANLSCGDDCISIGDHVFDLHIENIQCGPGHGISIGSLGRGGSNVEVKNINVTGASFTGTTNGARIKTWKVGRGYVRNVTFQNLTFDNVKNPIIIDQHYCDTGCKLQEPGVEISNVTYKEATGTSATKVAINLNCTMSAPCYGIYMESINITSFQPKTQVSANCSYAYGKEVNVVPANPCLLKK